MNDASTYVESASSRPTVPLAGREQYDNEATAILEKWQENNNRLRDRLFFDPECLRRHKSLVLGLILEDYQNKKKVKHSVAIQEYCEQFAGFGESLEQSIFRQLEVQQYLDSHPELLDLDLSFEWPEPGSTFIHFKVLEELGRGALARVYLCKHEELGWTYGCRKSHVGLDCL